MDQRAGGGQTALMLAAIFGHLEIVRLLLAAGADVQLQDSLGLTAREWANRRGSTEIAQLLSNELPGVTSPNKEPAESARPKTAEPNPAAEENTTPHTALGGMEQQLRGIADAQLAELDHERQKTAAEPKIAPQDDGLRWIKFQKRIIADHQRRQAEDALRAVATETKIGSREAAPGGTDDHLTTKPRLHPAQQEPPAETKSLAIAAGTEQRLPEDFNQGVESEVRAKPHDVARTTTESEFDDGWVPSGQTNSSGFSISAWVPDPVEIHGNGHRREKQEAPPVEQPTRAAMLGSRTSESINPRPVKRCPQCNTTFGDPLLSYCAYDAAKLISANDSLFNSPEARHWTPPTLWALVAIMAVLGGFLGYLINNYLSQKGSSSPIAAQNEQPENLGDDSPTIEGALSGMEVYVPEPEYPEQARTVGVTGRISVRVQVNKRGRVISARSSGGDWRLRAAAVKAAQKATFSAEKLAGRGASGTITYVFRL